jgi:hypothetical protein
LTGSAAAAAGKRMQAINAQRAKTVIIVLLPLQRSRKQHRPPRSTTLRLF